MMRSASETPDAIRNESDVEQKFLYPLLTAESPHGMAIKAGYVVTKQNIRSFEIDKGPKRKLYFPDYIIAIDGYPLAVVEGKGPDVQLGEAYREARLYAAELNSIYPSGLNPVSIIAATNSLEFWIGPADQSTPSVTLQRSDLEPYAPGLAAAVGLLGFDALKARATAISAAQRPARFFKPRRMIGGLAVQQEEVGQNSFGATLAAELGHIFNPVTRYDRLRVAKEAYVSSPRRERYVDPIDKVIRAAMPSWQARSVLIRDTSKPDELLAAFVAQRELEHQIILLIGEKGAGKTTFLYHLQATALPDELKSKTSWVHIDVNTAPVVKEEVYNWVRKEIISGLRQNFPDIDFDHFDMIQKIYSVEVNKFNKGIGSVLPLDSPERNHELYKELLRLQSDIHHTASCYTRYLGTERGVLIVVVFDNADKGPLDEQLLMFEVAQWLQKEFRVLVILPIREETYDNHRDRPPLDTALKDLAFRIEPPVFQQALLRRVQMALDEISSKYDSRKTYDLSNGFKISYAETERSYYLAAIAASIFEYDTYSRRLVMGLAGNNLRRIFEIFVEFCTSGHIGEGEILRIRQSKGEYILPLDVVMTVLLRANRRYYDGDASVIKNVLDLDDKDDRPTHFSRILVLSFLRSRFNAPGRSGIKGYFGLSDIHNALSPFGIAESVVRREVFYLAKANCIVAESLNDSDFSDSDLFKIGPVGFVHLELLVVPEYWAALAEDTNYPERSVAQRIADRIVVRDLHYSEAVALQNARALFNYILVQRDKSANESSSMLAASEYRALTDIDMGEEGISRKSASIRGGLWIEAVERLPPRTEMTGMIVNVVEALGLFVEVEPGLTGLLHRSRLSGGAVDAEQHQVGAAIRVRIVTVDPVKRRISLSLVSREKAGRSAEGP